MGTGDQGTRRPRGASRWFVLAAVVAAVGLPPSVAGATSDTIAPDGEDGAAIVDVTVEAGLRGYQDPGESILVRVTIEASGLLDGRIEVRGGNGMPVVSRDIQVPGGTTKSTLLVAPTTYELRQVEVRVVDGDGIVATRRIQMKAASDVELVGLLPQLLARAGDVPDQVNLDSDTGRAELVAVTTDILALGPLALDGFDSIIGSGADLAALSDAELSALTVWIGEGGRLLLDDDSGSGVLPAVWQPGVEGYAIAGIGEVRLLDGAASRGEFRSFIQPSSDQPNESINQGNEMRISPQTELATRAGVKLPSLGPLLIGLVVYAVLIGPVAYLVLRRMRRLTLAWVVLPALAIVTTLGVTVSGDRFRSTGSPATATYLEVSPGGASALTNVLTFSRSGGNATITAPARWGVDVNAALWFGFTDQGSTDVGTLEQDTDATRLSADLEPGQVITMAFSGPTAPESLATTAVIRDGEIVGTVTNDTAYTLHDVAVFSTSDAVSIGVVEPGATAEWSMKAPSHSQPFISLSDQVWGNPDIGVGFQTSDLAEFGIWGMADMRYGLYNEGTVRVAGWTDDRPADATAARSASDRTVVTTRQPIDPGDGPLHQASVRTQTTRSPWGQFGNGIGDTVMRYVVPPDALGEDLVLDMEPASGNAPIASLSVWTGTAWEELELDDEVAPVPDDALIGGTLLVRIEADPNFGFDPAATPVLRAEEVAS